MLALDFDRYRQIVEIVQQAARDAEEERFAVAAFIGWQLLTAQGAFGKKKTSYQQYLQQLGILKDRPATKAERRIDQKTQAQRNIENAQRIIDLDQKRRERAG